MSQATKTQSEHKLAPTEFVLRAIEKLRGNYRGIHVVYSGFNQAFRSYYGYDARETVDKMAQDKLIDIKPAKGGAMLYPYDPDYVSDKTQQVIADIVG